MIRHGTADRPEVTLHDVGGVAGLPLIEVDRQELEIDRGALPQPHEDVEQGVAVLPARHRDQDLVAVLDQGEVLDRLRGGAEDALLEAGDGVHGGLTYQSPPGSARGRGRPVFV